MHHCEICFEIGKCDSCGYVRLVGEHTVVLCAMKRQAYLREKEACLNGAETTCLIREAEGMPF